MRISDRSSDVCSSDLPGVVVFGSGGLDFLVVNRGSKLNAVGTPTQPIIFTGRRNIEGTATDDSQALWGGVVLLGRAPISDCIGGATGGAADCQSQFEGTADALFGGATATEDRKSTRLNSSN